jgi:hypothetical protein
LCRRGGRGRGRLPGAAHRRPRGSARRSCAGAPADPLLIVSVGALREPQVGARDAARVLLPALAARLPALAGRTRLLLRAAARAPGVNTEEILAALPRTDARIDLHPGRRADCDLDGVLRALDAFEAMLERRTARQAIAQCTPRRLLLSLVAVDAQALGIEKLPGLTRVQPSVRPEPDNQRVVDAERAAWLGAHGDAEVLHAERHLDLALRVCRAHVELKWKPAVRRFDRDY